MKTECHCLYCPKHPLHAKRDKLKAPTGFEPSHYVSDAKKTGRIVQCLEPASDAFDKYDIDPEDCEFPVTAYGGGCSMTGFSETGITVFAYCKNERYA